MSWCPIGIFLWLYDVFLEMPISIDCRESMYEQH